jgi:hypothetical protein
MISMHGKGYDINNFTSQDCLMGDVGFPTTLTGCRLDSEEHHPITFSRDKLIEVEGNPVYWSYRIVPIEWENEQNEIGARPETAFLGDLQFVPVGNALGDYQCTVYNSFRINSMAQTNSHNIYQMDTKITKKYCSNVDGQEELPDITRSTAKLTCPRIDIPWNPQLQGIRAMRGR